MGRTIGDYAERSKLSRESQLLHGFTYLWSIRNNMEDIRRRKGKVNWGKSEGEMNHERLWTRKQTGGFGGEGAGGWVSLIVGIKEGMYCMEH